MRADKFFAEKFGSRTKAAEELSAGRILRGNKPLAPKDEVQEGDIFTFIAPEKRFVSNGGYKLEKALIAEGKSLRISERAQEALPIVFCKTARKKYLP